MLRSMILPMHPIRMLKHFDNELNGRTIVSFLAFLKGGLDPVSAKCPKAPSAVTFPSWPYA